MTDEFGEDSYTGDEDRFYPSRPRRSETMTTRVTRVALIALSTAVIILMFVVSMIKPQPQPTATTVPASRSARSTPVAINWTRIRADVSDGMAEAEAKAEQYARHEIKLWMHEVRLRATKGFIDELLGYMTQQRLALQSLYYGARHYIDPSQPDADEAVAHEIEMIFGRHAMSPPVGQARIEEIASETVALYVSEVGKTLEVLPTTYNLNEAEWKRFLGDAAEIASGHGSTRRVPLVLKGLTVGSIASGVALAQPTAQLVRTVAAKLTGRTVATTAGTVAKGMGRMGGPVFLAVMVWDGLDHLITRNRLRPLLRSSLNDYFDSVEAQLVDEVTGAVDRVQVKIIAAISRGKE